MFFNDSGSKIVSRPSRFSVLRNALIEVMSPGFEVQRCSTISRQLRVLVVDDDNGQRMTLKIMLSKDGYQVDTAEDGDDAVKAAHNVSYDVILMDGCMPNKTGLEATEEIRANEAAKGLEMEDRSPFHVPLAQTIKNV
jgi:CheY-like chemotaxis protein